jgi:hypothetical protein
MKIKIKPFIFRLIIDNLFYIIGNIIIIILIIITIKIGLSNIVNYNNKSAALKIELTKLQNKINLIKTTIPSSEKLTEDINFLNTLIPNIEDYFSVIYSLEKLSQKTNFIITSYNINLITSTREKLNLNIIGNGDSQSFIDFLKEYNYSGGRLITSNNISLDPNSLGSIKINLTFYSKNVLTDKNIELPTSDKIFKEIESLKSKVDFTFNDNFVSTSPDLNYPRKANPF